MIRVSFEFGAVGAIQSSHVFCELHDRHLHAQADPKVRDPVLPGILNSLNFALNPPVSKSTRHQNPPHPFEEGLGPFPLHIFRIHIDQIHLAVTGEAAVDQGLMKAFVGIFQMGVLSNNRYGRGPLRVLDPLNDSLPSSQIRFTGPDVESLDDPLVESFPVQNKGNLVN